MKRHIPWLCSLLFLFALAGCTAEPTVFETLSSLAKKEYESIRLEVIVSADGDTLSGTYEAEAAEGGYTVRYSYEQMATIGGEDGELVFPDEPVAVKSGRMTVRGGEIVSREGDEADLPLGCLTPAGLDFSEKNFANVQTGEGSFSAALTSPDAFIGGLTGTDGRVDVSYAEGGLLSLTLVYRNGLFAVEMRYTFTPKG